ncbi:hypothetical protein MMC13_003413 [Lambiella insularis]|nr:hypothetical protein [Lambiella insularis]
MAGPVGEGFPRVMIPIHLVQPHAIVDDSMLSRVYTDFLRAARYMIQNGKSTAELISGDDIMVDLVYRPRREDDAFTSCSWASEVVRDLGELDEFMRLDWVVFLCPMMRWLLAPTEKTYAQIPDIMRPTCGQRLIAHMASIDLCPIPIMRELLVNDHRDWMTALIKSHVSVNWAYGREGALEHTADGRLRLSEAFRLHVIEYSNWSVTSRILEWFPRIHGRIRIVPETPDMLEHKPTFTGRHINTGP